MKPECLGNACQLFLTRLRLLPQSVFLVFIAVKHFHAADQMLTCESGSMLYWIRTRPYTRLDNSAVDFSIDAMCRGFEACAASCWWSEESCERRLPASAVVESRRGFYVAGVTSFYSDSERTRRIRLFCCASAYYQFDACLSKTFAGPLTIINLASIQHDWQQWQYASAAIHDIVVRKSSDSRMFELEAIVCKAIPRFTPLACANTIDSQVLLRSGEGDATPVPTYNNYNNNNYESTTAEMLATQKRKTTKRALKTTRRQSTKFARRTTSDRTTRRPESTSTTRRRQECFTKESGSHVSRDFTVFEFLGLDEDMFDGSLSSCKNLCKLIRNCRGILFDTVGWSGPECRTLDISCGDFEDICVEPESETEQYWSNRCVSMVRVDVA